MVDCPTTTRFGLKAWLKVGGAWIPSYAPLLHVLVLRVAPRWSWPPTGLVASVLRQPTEPVCSGSPLSH